MRKLTLFMLFSLAACGAEPGSSGNETGEPADPSLNTSFAAENQTPGIYRDTYRLLNVSAAETDAATAVSRMQSDLLAKLQNTASLDALADDEKEVVRGLFVLAVRSMQATRHHPDVSREIGEYILKRALELDRARPAWNEAHEAREHVAVSEANAALIAQVTEWTIAKAVDAPIDAQGNPLTGGLSAQTAAQCVAPTVRAVWIPGASTSVWVPQYCYADTVLPGYCEPARYVEGYCYDVWVDECDGGRYENRGRYEYVCYSSYDCRYVWRDYYVWVADNYCSDGYYDEQCTAGSYEQGLCYPDKVVPGYCIPGHYTQVYPNGSWSFRSGDTAACDPVIPAQSAVARTSAQILSGPLADDIEDDSWRAAVQNLVQIQEDPDDGAYVAAVVQVIGAAQQPAQ